MLSGKHGHIALWLIHTWNARLFGIIWSKITCYISGLTFFKRRSGVTFRDRFLFTQLVPLLWGHIIVVFFLIFIRTTVRMKMAVANLIQAKHEISHVKYSGFVQENEWGQNHPKLWSCNLIFKKTQKWSLLALSLFTEFQDDNFWIILLTLFLKFWAGYGFL